jgi:hypothetical protein
LPLALKPPFVDVPPGTVFIPFLVDESKFVVSFLGPRHPLLAVDSDHRHEAGKDNPFTKWVKTEIRVEISPESV